MKASPFFSIIVPTYNRADIISSTIHSLLKQDFHDFEIIVVDDGSADETGERIKRDFAANEKVFYYSKQNEERGAARNYGAKKAHGKYVNFFDSDDLALSNHLSEAHSLIQKNNSPPFFHLNYRTENEKGVILSQGEDLTNIDSLVLDGNPFSCNGVFMQKELCSANPFQEDRKIAASEDYLLWLRLVARYDFCYSNTVTSIIIEHADRSVNQIQKDKLIERKMGMLNYALSDEFILAKFGSSIKRIELNTLTYIALHLALSNYKKDAMKFYKRALRLSPISVLSKRSLAIVKHLILPK
ncbi:MAG: glycosyltransferase family A protein [Bacteroidota bacterium]